MSHIKNGIFSISMKVHFSPEFNGNYSIHSPEVRNMPTGNIKRRLTMACFISTAGKMILPTFVDKDWVVNNLFGKLLVGGLCRR